MSAGAVWFNCLVGLVNCIPLYVLVYGRNRSRKRSLLPEVPEAPELSLARRLSVFPVIAPVCLLLLSMSSSRALGNLFPVLWIGIPILALGTALLASVLFALYASGLERFTSPLAACACALLTAVMCMGGSVAA